MQRGGRGGRTPRFILSGTGWLAAPETLQVKWGFGAYTLPSECPAGPCMTRCSWPLLPLLSPVSGSAI